ncbi:MAG: antA/AntB antirepressor family protein [Bacteroidetes bacterium]|nr:antA/AntB antirepressor family protein [Bacteroidota bacterium]
MELIKIQEQDGKQVVSARELHSFLGSRKDFTSWVKMRIAKYGLRENEDYFLLTKLGEQSPKGGHNKVDYLVTADCAKELAMVEGTEKGRQARQYFIECEKQLKSIAETEKAESEVPVKILIDQMKVLLGQGRKLNVLEQKQDAIQRQLEELRNEDSVKMPAGYVSVIGFARIKKLFIDNTAAVLLSKVAKKECIRTSATRYKIADVRWGFVWAYPEHVLENVFNAYYELLLMLR